MKMKTQINSKMYILLALIVGGAASFLETPSNQFQSTFNSTFLTDNGKLYRPIVIPNLTEQSDLLYASKPKIKGILKKILQNDPSEESTQENNSEEFKPSENRFSSRYSSKEETAAKGEDSEETKSEEVTSITDIPILLQRNESISSKISLPSPPDAKLFTELSDVTDDSEEKKAYHYPDSIEAREREESEIASTTNEPYPELRSATSIRTSPDEHFEHYETSSGVADESDEEESEEKTSLHDYHNSGSKNYHSIQTPLDQIKYRGPHSFGNDYDPEKTRETTPSRLRLIKHNWPYTRKQLNTELEENEISDEERNDRLESEKWNDEDEPKTNTKDLELAVHKDENRYNRSRTHSYIDDRKRRQQQERNLVKEEEKDKRSPFYKVVQQYTVNEEPEAQPVAKFPKVPKKKPPTAQPTQKPRNIFFDNKPTIQPEDGGNSRELKLDFPVHQFLGPVVFDKDNSKIQTPKPKITKLYKLPHYVKDLESKEKLVQDIPTNQRFQKAAFADKDKYESFNHLEESDEMYSAILANIQSVFGLRTQPLGGGRRNQPEGNLQESALTWSVPIKRRKAYEGVTQRGSDGKVTSERAPAHRKFLFPTDVSQPRGE